MRHAFIIGVRQWQRALVLCEKRIVHSWAASESEHIPEQTGTEHGGGGGGGGHVAGELCALWFC